MSPPPPRDKSKKLELFWGLGPDLRDLTREASVDVLFTLYMLPYHSIT